MKRKALYLNYAAVFYLVVISKECQGAATIPQNSKELLKQKKEELEGFVKIVEANAGNCNAVLGCSDDCTRPSCSEYGTRGDHTSYKCLQVLNNTFCDSCTDRNFDFTRSFLRRVDVDKNKVRTVCTHRNLDEAFKNSSLNDPDHFFRVFFGAADGTFRIYPGADEACHQNGSLVIPYDPRIRDWYIDSTRVPKIVTILIDTGNNMRSQDYYQGEPSDKAMTTALTFLLTLKKNEDYVSIVAFNATGNRPLNHTHIYDNDTLSSYTANLNLSIFQTTLKTNTTATTNAITTAISDLTNFTSPGPNYLKVVIVLTSGEQINNLSDITSVTRSSGVYLFVYNFVPTNRTAQCDPSGRASMEDIQFLRRDNPLYALQSYFTFMATVHNSSMKDSVDYGRQTTDFSGVDNSTLTLSKAAFGPSGELLGVVGIDFFQNKIDTQYNNYYTNINFESIVGMRQGFTYDSSTSTSISVCFNYTDACPNLDTTPAPRFLCKSSTGDAKIGCCGSCLRAGINWKLVGGISGGVGGFLLILLVIATMGCCIRRKRRGARAALRRQDVQAVDVAKESPLLAGAGLGVHDGLKAPGTKD